MFWCDLFFVDAGDSSDTWDPRTAIHEAWSCHQRSFVWDLSVLMKVVMIWKAHFESEVEDEEHHLRPLSRWTRKYESIGI